MTATLLLLSVPGLQTQNHLYFTTIVTVKVDKPKTVRHNKYSKENKNKADHKMKL